MSKHPENSVPPHPMLITLYRASDVDGIEEFIAKRLKPDEYISECMVIVEARNDEGEWRGFYTQVRISESASRVPGTIAATFTDLYWAIGRRAYRERNEDPVLEFYAPNAVWRTEESVDE